MSNVIRFPMERVTGRVESKPFPAENAMKEFVREIFKREFEDLPVKHQDFFIDIFRSARKYQES